MERTTSQYQQRDRTSVCRHPYKGISLLMGGMMLFSLSRFGYGAYNVQASARVQGSALVEGAAPQGGASPIEGDNRWISMTPSPPETNLRSEREQPTKMADQQATKKLRTNVETSGQSDEAARPEHHTER